MNPNCNNLNIIKDLEQTNKRSIDIIKDSNTIIESNSYKFNLKYNNTTSSLENKLSVYINLFYVDITLYNPAIYYLTNIQDHLLHFYKLNINNEDIKDIQSICNKFLNKHLITPDYEYITYIHLNKETIMVYYELKKIDKLISSSKDILVSLTEIKLNSKILNIFQVDNTILEYFKKEGYYNLISQGKQQSIIMLPKIGYYYMDSEVLTINKETGYIELYKHGQDKQYIVRVSLMFKERKNIHTLDEITDINETIYFFDNKIIIPSLRQIRLLSIKKNK
jgi:hypothetical protein